MQDEHIGTCSEAKMGLLLDDNNSKVVGKLQNVGIELLNEDSFF